MENPKIFVIAIKKNITPDVTMSIATKLISANEDVKNCGIIICSLRSKIILSASRFQEISGLPIFHSEILTENPENSKDNQKFYNSEKLNQFFYTKLQGKLQLDFEKLIYHYRNIFLFIEYKFVEMKFPEIELILQHEYKSAKIYIYNFIKKVRLNVSEEDSSKSQELLLSAIKNEISSFLKENSQEVIEILEDLRKEFDHIVKKAKEFSKSLVKRKRINEEQKEQARKVSTSVSRIKTQFSSIKSSIDNLKNATELLYPPISEDLAPFNLISSLTLQDNDDWELKLSNTTPNYYRQLEIWCIETESKLCEFTLIEPNSNYKKIIDINIPEKEIFFKHLIAQTEGKTISNAYTITPIFIDSVTDIEEENCYEINLINLSKTMKFSHLQVACDKIPEAFDVKCSKIGYGEFSTAEVKYEKTPKSAVFVVLDRKKIVSNFLEVVFSDGEESDEE